MTDALRTQFRLDILRALDRVRSNGMTLLSLTAEMRAAGFAHAESADTQAALDYLGDPDRRLIRRAPGVAGPASDRFCIAPAGVDECERMRANGSI